MPEEVILRRGADALANYNSINQLHNKYLAAGVIGLSQMMGQTDWFSQPEFFASF
jgi:hypothetical protein